MWYGRNALRFCVFKKELEVVVCGRNLQNFAFVCSFSVDYICRING